MNDTRPILREEELYRLWERLALTGATFVATAGERVMVIAPGRRNDGPGPDFLDAVLIIDGRMRAGAVEMHLREDHWMAHGHADDPAYASVILHLLAEAPSAPLLPIPTVAAAALGDAAPAPAGEQPADHGEIDDPTALLTELAWGRILRRATAIVRGEPQLPSRDRVRRAFIRRLFDALGYASNRKPMGEIAELMLDHESLLAAEPFEMVAGRVLAGSGARRELLAGIGAGFMEPGRLDALLDRADVPRIAPAWRYDARPANAPERRLWGGAKLLFDIMRGDLLGRLFGAVRRRSFDAAVGPLVVRLGSEVLVGEGRAREIVVNALLPAAIAEGVLLGDRRLVEGGCILYHDAPSLAPNRLVRSVERRHLRGAALHGAFRQQGAIEFHQRYLANDKRNLSFIAEGAPLRSAGGERPGRFPSHTLSQS